MIGGIIYFETACPSWRYKMGNGTSTMDDNPLKDFTGENFMEMNQCDKCGKNYATTFKACPDCFFRSSRLLDKSNETENKSQCEYCGNYYDSGLHKCPHCFSLKKVRLVLVIVFILALFLMIIIVLRNDYIKSRSHVHVKKISWIQPDNSLAIIFPLSGNVDNTAQTSRSVSLDRSFTWHIKPIEKN